MTTPAPRSTPRAIARSRATLLTAVIAAVCMTVVGCDDDEAPPPASNKLPLPLEIGTGPEVELPSQVVLVSDSSRLQRIELDIDGGGRLDATSPVQLPDRVVLATAADEVVCLVVERGRRRVVQRLDARDPGAPGRELDLPEASGTPTALYGHGQGCLLAMGSEVRYFDFAAERPFSVRVFDLPPGRSTHFFARVGRAVWAFDSARAPRTVHAIDVGRELPRFLASWPLPSLDSPPDFRDAGPVASRQTDDDDERQPGAVLLATVDGRDELLGLAPGCRPDAERSCLVWAARDDDGPAREPATELLVDGASLVLTTHPNGLLSVGLPRFEALEPDEPAPQVTRDALETRSLDGLDRVRDARRWGNTLLVLREASDGVSAELVLARIDAEGDAELVTRIPVPADSRAILEVDDRARPDR